MRFSEAVKVILEFEGGYTNDFDDNGGETKYGISKRSYPDLDIKRLTKKAAIAIYEKDYWNRCKCDELPTEFRLAVFDMAVNCGIRRSSKELQRAIGATVDGVIGKQTVGLAQEAGMNELRRYLDNRVAYYFKLRDFNKYGRGWINRAIHVALLIGLP